jgi:hypothetical protein
VGAEEAPPGSMSYGWPLAPFGEQHPIRAFFGDPRIGSAGGTSFHFGVDVSAPNGTPVYAVAAGTVELDVAGGPENVAVLSATATHGYWHIEPAVTQGQHVAQGELLGRIAAPWEHVHLAERTPPQGPYVNPLREGALAPFAKYGAPTVDSIVAERDGQTLDPSALAGAIDLIADAHDVTPIPPLTPYTHMPVTPARVQWKLVAEAEEVMPWRTSADFQTTLPANSLYATVYAPGTTQNHPPKPGVYRFQLARAFDTAAHPDGSYRLDVEVSDTRGNASTRRLAIVIANNL